MESVPDIPNIGLLNGKMGVCIYFFRLAEKTGEPEYQEFAEQLIDAIYQTVSDHQSPPEFDNGLAGIAWGVEYLVRHRYVEADTDAVLSDVDDKLFRHITTSRNLPVTVQKGILGYMAYVIARLEGRGADRMDLPVQIFRRLLTELVNRLATFIDEQKVMLTEPRFFSLTWDLPALLVLLAECYSLQIHRTKIERILDDLAFPVLSLYPRLEYHRFCLLFGLESILTQIPLNNEWRSHADLLKQGIDRKRILHHELKSKNIGFVNGLAGIAYISRQLYRITGDPELLLDDTALLQKIVRSEYLDERYELLEKRLPGFASGLTGIAMEILNVIHKEPELVE